MFTSKAMLIAAAASAASIPSSWQPIALDSWDVMPFEDTCGMIAPLGQEGSDDLRGMVTLAPRPDSFIVLTVTRGGWAVPEERGTIKIWFDNGYGMFRPLYDQPADLIPEDGNGTIVTLVDPDFIAIASRKSSIDVVVEGPELGDPQRMTIPLGDLEAASQKLADCLANN